LKTPFDHVKSTFIATLELEEGVTRVVEEERNPQIDCNLEPNLTRLIKNQVINNIIRFFATMVF
jgi:hypothetical protein